MTLAAVIVVFIAVSTAEPFFGKKGGRGNSGGGSGYGAPAASYGAPSGGYGAPSSGKITGPALRDRTERRVLFQVTERRPEETAVPEERREGSP